MAKSKKQIGFERNKKKEIIKEKTYEVQENKTINDLKNAVAQLQYPLVINLIPTKRSIKNEQLSFGCLMRKQDIKEDIGNFNKNIIGINISQNERVMLNTLIILISNSNFQLDIKNKNVDLSQVTFRFSKNIIRNLSGVLDIKSLIKGLGKVYIFKNNNKGGNYVVDRLFFCVEEGNYYKFRFSKYLAYDFSHKSDKGYAKRRGFYNKKRNTIYETLFLELLFVKTAVFKDKKALAIFEVKTKTLLENINLYNLVHENKKRAIALLNSFFKASFEFGVFIGEMPKFDVKTLNRDSKDKISLKINPEFDWIACDWNKWNVEKI